MSQSAVSREVTSRLESLFHCMEDDAGNNFSDVCLKADLDGVALPFEEDDFSSRSRVPTELQASVAALLDPSAAGFGDF